MVSELIALNRNEQTLERDCEGRIPADPGQDQFQPVKQDFEISKHVPANRLNPESDRVKKKGTGAVEPLMFTRILPPLRASPPPGGLNRAWDCSDYPDADR